MLETHPVTLGQNPVSNEPHGAACEREIRKLGVSRLGERFTLPQLTRRVRPAYEAFARDQPKEECFETVRAREFPRCPSRLGCLYLFQTRRWAVAIIPIVLLLVKEGRREEAADYLREVLIWITQRYSIGLGLAGPNATPEAEVRQVIGLAIPQIPEVQRREESYLATVFLDLSAFLNLPRLYTFARDDFRRFKLLLSAITTADTAGQYLLDGPDVAHEINAPYRDEVSDGWTSAAPHLAAEATPRFLESIDRSWDHLAVSAVLRDRHFVCAWPALSA